jgi:hypothetical protein
VIAQWWTWVPLYLVAAGGMYATAKWRWRRAKAARRRASVAPSLTDRIEAHIAVGSLSGIAPSDIRCHVLLVVNTDGELAVSGTVRGSLRALIVAKASAAFAEEAFAAHDRDHEGER